MVIYKIGNLWPGQGPQTYKELLSRNFSWSHHIKLSCSEIHIDVIRSSRDNNISAIISHINCSTNLNECTSSVNGPRVISVSLELAAFTCIHKLYILACKPLLTLDKWISCIGRIPTVDSSDKIPGFAGKVLFFRSLNSTGCCL